MAMTTMVETPAFRPAFSPIGSELGFAVASAGIADGPAAAPAGADPGVNGTRTAHPVGITHGLTDLESDKVPERRIDLQHQSSSWK